MAYHVRAKRGALLFARCWLLVEGETEFTLLPELARLLGHEVLSLNAIIAHRTKNKFSKNPTKVIDALIKKVLERI